MKIIVIADDLTGANDTAVQFAENGYKTTVFLEADAEILSNFSSSEVWVFDTETRGLSTAAAYQKLESIGRVIAGFETALVYKKIDSTLRGNIGAEIDALMDTMRVDVAVVAPAYPANNRITVNGLHYLNGKLISETEIFNDSKTPVKESYIPDLLKKQLRQAVAMITVDQIRKKNLSSIIIDLSEKVVVMDTITNEDLQLITANLTGIDKQILWVGSAGLARHLPLDTNKSKKAKPVFSFPKRPDKAVLIIAGSVSAVTRKQVAELAKRDCYQMILDPVRLLECTPSYMESQLQTGKHRLDSGSDLVITTDYNKETKKTLSNFATRTGLSAIEMGDMIAAQLGWLGSRLISECELTGAVLTGGDIAYQVCRQLKGDALSVISEVEQGIPLCWLHTGQTTHLPVVTKAGAFGNEQSLVQAIAKLRKLAE